MGLFSFSCYQRFFVVVVVVVEAELFYFPIETHTLEFNTPFIIMYLFGTILLIQQIENGGDARREGNFLFLDLFVFKMFTPKIKKVIGRWCEVWKEWPEE